MGNTKNSNISVESQKEKRKSMDQRKLFEGINIENIFKSTKRCILKFKKTQQIPEVINSKKFISEHSITKWLKTRQRIILKTIRGKQCITYRGRKIEMIADF